MQQHLLEFPKEGSTYTSNSQTVLDAAIAAGIPVFHVCGGKAKCSTCRVLVLEGLEQLTPPNKKELALHRHVYFPPNVRLACQTRLTGGPVRLRRIIQDESDVGLYIGHAEGTSDEQLGEEKEMVLFFLDIRNFTQFVETHLAFDVIHIVRKLFSLFNNIIQANGGHIVETTGDGLYAVFGCEGGKVVSVQAAVAAALGILREMEGLSDAYFEKYFSRSLQAGIGLHVGQVISGTIRIGTEEHMVVMGHPVNVASRLQSATRELNNSCVVSAQVHELLAADMQTDACAHIRVKGVNDELKVFLLGKSFTAVKES